MADIDRRIRVFVSSTFRDMQAERDYLVKFIFPQLRQCCESRGVTWSEVDLRWGITEEEAERGEVVHYCLDEIDRCRPYFIGLLGDYYGTLAGKVAPNLEPRPGWPDDAAQRSLTELEIVHGVLADPRMADRAFFYFRDPGYLLGLSPEDRQRFTNAEAFADLRLSALKEQIRARYREGRLKVPPRENYRNPEVLGRAIRRDFTRLINELFPQNLKPDPIERERLDHEALARARSRVYVGRREYFDRLDGHAAGADAPLVLLGEPGMGKSALLANWFLRYQESHPSEFALIHFIGQTPDSADPIRLLRRIMSELRRHLPAELPADVPSEAAAVREEFPQWLARAASMMRVVLILDGLNQLEDRDAGPDLSWLPASLPATCRLIVSTLPGRSLDALARRDWLQPRQTLTVRPLEELERSTLLREFLQQFSKRLPATAVATLCSAPQTASPLFLLTLLNELRQLGEHEQVHRELEHYLAARDPLELYDRILARWERDYSAGCDLVASACRLISVARRGLSEVELLDLHGHAGQRLPRAIWTPLYLAAESSLTQRSGILSFSHQYLRDAVDARYLTSSDVRRAAHHELGEYFSAQSGLGPRRVDELPWQLRLAAEWPRLAALFADVAFVVAAREANPLDVRECWAQLKANAHGDPTHAYRHLLDDPDADPDQMWPISNLLWELGHPKEAAKLRGRLVDHFRQSGNRRQLARALPNHAVSLRASGDLTQASALYDEAIQLNRELGELEQVGLCMGNLAAIFEILGALDKARELLKQQEQICRSLNDWEGLARSLGNQAAIHKSQGRLDDALDLYVEEERLSRDHADPTGLASALSGQAGVLRIRGRLADASQLLQRVIDTHRQLGNQRGVAEALGQQALLLDESGRRSNAFEGLREAESMWRHLGEPRGLAGNLANQAKLLASQATIGEALVMLDEAAQLYAGLDDKGGIGGCSTLRATIQLARGDLAGAENSCRKAEQIYRELGRRRELADCLGTLGYVLRMRAELPQAAAVFQEQQSICQQLGDRGGVARALGNRAIVLNAQGRRQQALLLHQQEEETFRAIGDPAGLQVSLGNQAMIRLDAGDASRTWTQLKEQEALCRQLNARSALAGCLGNQAIVLKASGDAAGAMDLSVLSEALFREIGDPAGLSIAMVGRAMLTSDRPGQKSVAIRVAREALDIASAHGLKDIAARISQAIRLIEQRHT